MLDGIKFYYSLVNFEAWKRAVNIELFTPIDLETGAANGKLRNIKGLLRQTITSRGNFETYQVTIKETITTSLMGKRSVSYFLILNGSLHKNYFRGTNHLPFKWDDLQNEITKLETGLHLSDHFAELVNLEIGLNISVPFPVFKFLQQNLISYKGNTFNKYNPDKNGVCLGYVCHLRQYSVKIYDKAKQYNLPDHLMRFELRYLKMQVPKERSIKTLSDLRSHEKVNGLLSLLLTAWDNVLLSDSSINLKHQGLKPQDRQLLDNGNNPNFWEKLKTKGSRNFNYQRSKFRDLVNKYGEGWHNKLKELIKKEWENLFKNCTILPCVQKPELNKFTVKIKGQNVQTGHYKIDGEFFDIKKKRVCQSCGRDISNQDRRSRFCSSKYVGEAAAHRCRNADSNPRNNLKHKIRRIMNKGVLFDITPFTLAKKVK